MKELSIVSSEFYTPEELQEYIRTELDFPDYYGENLSALYDCLTESTEELFLEFDLDSFPDDIMKEYIKKVWKVCEDAVEENELLELLTIFPEGEEW
ncbi:MAG: barstar family protein [Eubacteriales bacterium]|nr:barstar family protein [Eubacteriales bacterium]